MLSIFSFLLFIIYYTITMCKQNQICQNNNNRINNKSCNIKNTIKLKSRYKKTKSNIVKIIQDNINSKVVQLDDVLKMNQYDNNSKIENNIKREDILRHMILFIEKYSTYKKDHYIFKNLNNNIIKEYVLLNMEIINPDCTIEKRYITYPLHILQIFCPQFPLISFYDNDKLSLYHYRYQGFIKVFHWGEIVQLLYFLSFLLEPTDDTLWSYYFVVSQLLYPAFLLKSNILLTVIDNWLCQRANLIQSIFGIKQLYVLALYYKLPLLSHLIGNYSIQAIKKI